MTFEDYISEHEASHITGVSGTTLNRFADAGYLKIETDADGLKLFSKSELTTVFGSLSSSSSNGPASNGKAAARISGEAAAALSAQVEVVRAPEAVPSPAVSSPAVPSPATAVPAFTASALTAPTDISQSGKRRDLLEFLDREVVKLKQSLDLQQTLLEQRDRELKDIREQRDWLKARLERLEEKSERDQILLLSETQTIRKLIAMEERRKSPVRLALEWLGINTQPSASNQTIEVRKSPAQKQPQAAKTAPNSAN